ncbi:MAG: DUF5060 domain-containing protein, partial [Planctomycetota bacterium]
MNRLFTIALVVFLAAAGRAETTGSRFDPNDFQPLETIQDGDNGSFNTTSGQVSLNGGPPLNGVFSNVSGRAIAVFCFSNVYLSGTVTISGTNALAILSRSDLLVDTALDISGGHATTNLPGARLAGGYPGSRGGWAGDTNGFMLYPATAAANGPGYGGNPSNWFAAGGGAGHGAAGGRGAPTWDGGLGGATCGNSRIEVLWGGSGGAGGCSTNSNGGAGGGAIQLNAAGHLTLASSANVAAHGGRGSDGTNTPSGFTSGGGSGGSILVVAGETILIQGGAQLSAAGGRGGNGGGPTTNQHGRGGGGGAGGRIALYGWSLSNSGTLDVSGASGGRSEDTGGDGYAGGGGTLHFEIEAPAIQNTGLSGITTNAASLIGTLSSTGMAETTVFLYWGDVDRTTNKGTWAASTNLGVRSEGEVITNRVTGLSTNALYYFRFYATNAHGGVWAEPSLTFQTLGGAYVDNADGATDVGLTSARLNGSFAGMGDAEVWIFWGTNDGVEVKGNWPTNELLGARGEGDFSAAVGGLTTGRVYHYRCYASNILGGVWAESSAVFTTRASSIVSHDRDPVPRFERLEMTIQNASNYANPFNPLEADIWGRFTSPSGTQTRINAFWNGNAWKLRFAGAETGLWTYTVFIDDSGPTRSQGGGFTVTGSSHHGWIRTSPRDPHYLEHYDGTQFFGVGFCKPWNLTNSMFVTMRTNGCNVFTYWLAPWDSKELISTNTGYDRYDTTNAAEIDVILQAAETNDVKMIFTVWYHGLLRDSSHPWGNENWSRNPFKSLTTCGAFFTDTNSWHYQQRLYRYILARWGYS